MMRNLHYILGPDHELIEADLHTWAKWFETHDRHVAETNVGVRWVSTVFLGLDHQFDEGPPLLFETMVFKRNPDGSINFSEEEVDRYSTWAEAEAGHAAIVEQVRARLDGLTEGEDHATRETSAEN